jgi:LacI family transcriptional regulator
VVALNASAARVTGVCRVRPDNAAAVELPLRRLAELGHTSVAFLTAPRRLMADPDRLRHFRRLSRALGLRATVLYSPLTLGDVQQATRTVLAGPDGPTAVITNSDYTAHAVYKAARELARRIGPDVSVVGHDDLATSELLDPPLATIWLNRREMGRALMLRLLGRVPPDDYVAPVELIERASLQAPDPRRAQLPVTLSGGAPAAPRPGSFAVR